MTGSRAAILCVLVCCQALWATDQAKVLTSLDDKFEVRLQEAGAGGYAIGAAFPFVSDLDPTPNTSGEPGYGADYSEALLFILTPSPASHAYKVVTLSDLVSAQKVLDNAGAQGYRVHGSDAFMLRRWSWGSGAGKYLLVLVQEPGRAFDYRIVDATRRGFGQEVLKAQSEGYNIVQYMSTGIFLLQRDKEMRSGPVGHFSVVQDEDARKVERALQDSGGKGFAARYITASGDAETITVISEQRQPGSKFDYRIVSSGKLDELQAGVDGATKAGYCIVPSGVFATRRKMHRDRGLTPPPDRAVIMLEKATEVQHCAYQIEARRTTRETLAAVSGSLAQGRRMVGIGSTASLQFIVTAAEK